MKPIFHPGTATLIAYADGGLGARRERSVERHVAGCGRCSDELAMIHVERELLAHGATVVSIDADAVARNRAGVMARIAALPQEPAAASEWIRDRVGAELRLYLGDEAASNLLRSTPPAELMGRALRLLSMFLGRKSAEAIAANIAAGAAAQAESHAC